MTRGLLVSLATASFVVGLAHATSVTPPPARLECAGAVVAVAADRVAVRSGRWGDPRTWGGAVPGPGEVAEVPAGIAVELDAPTASLGGVLVRGSLTFADRPLALTSAYVLVVGPDAAFRIGTAERPYAHRAVITLTGTETAASVHGAGVMAMGTKFLGGDAGATIAIHGHRRDAVAFTRIAAGVEAGATEIALVDAVDWRPGDRVVVGPPDFVAFDAEEREVAAVLDGGRRVRFTEPLGRARYGELQTYRHGGRDVVVDERVHVALLTRDIVIQGDEASTGEERVRTYNAPGGEREFAYRRGFGAHVISMASGSMRVEGVELRRVGQTGRQGRYPLHYHHGGDRAGDYLRGNSIHHSFQRGVVMHQTSGLEASDNVGYHVVNHIFVASEDGTTNERGNVMRHNFGALAINPVEDDLAFPNETDTNDSDQDGERASVFWASQPSSVYVDNVAAGTLKGQGFFFDNPPYKLRDEPVDLTFTGNVAYANGHYRNGLFNYAPSTSGHGLFVRKNATPDEPAAPVAFGDFAAFKNGNAGVWAEGTGNRYEGLVLSDNFMGVMSIGETVVEDALIVGQTANTLGADLSLESDYKGRGGAIHLTNAARDKTFDVRDVTVVNQFGGALMVGIHLTDGRAEDVRAGGNRPVYFIEEEEDWYLDDVDGSLTGNGGPVRVIAPQSPLRGPEAAYLPGTGGGYALPLDGAPVRIGLPVAEYPLIDDFDRNGDGGYGWAGPWLDPDGRTRFNQRDSEAPVTGRDYAFGEARAGYAWMQLEGQVSPDERVRREGSLAGVESATLRLAYRTIKFEDDNGSRASVPTDSAFVSVRRPDGTWQTVATVYGHHADWEELETPLPEEALHENFAIGFHTVTDKSGDRLEVDMVSLQVTSGAVATPPGGGGGGGGGATTDLTDAATAAPDVVIAPNPVEGVVALTATVPGDGPREVAVRDALGRLVARASWPAGERLRLDTAPWGPGAYVVEVRDRRGDRLALKRLLVR